MNNEFPKELLPNKPKCVGEEPDPPIEGWAEGDTPTDADYCPHCNELVEYFNQVAGRNHYGQRWHRGCWWESMGYEELDREEAPSCGNCGPTGKFNYRREKPNPLPDAGGVLVEFRCITYGNYMIRFDPGEFELTENDKRYLNRVSETAEHWFSRGAGLVLHNIERGDE